MKKIAVKVKNSVEKAVVQKAVAKRGRKPKIVTDIDAVEETTPKKVAAKSAVKGRKRRAKATKKLNNQQAETKVQENAPVVDGKEVASNQE